MEIVARLDSSKAYDQLIAAFRARMAELETTGETVDHVAGIPAGYTTKIMAQVKSLGRISLPALLCTLGLQIVLVEDPEFGAIRGRMQKSAHNRWTRPLKPKPGNGMTFNRAELARGPLAGIRRRSQIAAHAPRAAAWHRTSGHPC